jgi:hypothetical protein
MIQPSSYLEFFKCVNVFRCIWFNSRYVGINQPPIVTSIAYLDTSANIPQLGAVRIQVSWCHLMLLNSRQRTSIANIQLNSGHIFRNLSRHASDCIRLGRASQFQGTPQIASSSTECYFVALFCRYSTTHYTIFTLIYFCLHSPTSLLLAQYGTYGQPGEESPFTEESRRQAGH